MVPPAVSILNYASASGTFLSTLFSIRFGTWRLVALTHYYLFCILNRSLCTYVFSSIIHCIIWAIWIQLKKTFAIHRMGETAVDRERKHKWFQTINGTQSNFTFLPFLVATLSASWTEKRICNRWFTSENPIKGQFTTGWFEQIANDYRGPAKTDDALRWNASW